jgi:hypothetical protein
MSLTGLLAEDNQRERVQQDADERLIATRSDRVAVTHQPIVSSNLT